MSLEYAILGFLNYHPYTGYDLKKIFDSSVRHFWPADQSQIYRTLTRLTEEGYAGMEKVPQADRPDRKVYHITDTGRAELMKWLAGPPPMDPTRSPALIQVFFAGQLPDEDVLAKFEMVVQVMRQVLAQYDQVPGQLEEHARLVDSPREQFFWLLTLDLGLRTMRANLEWAESVIERLKQGEVPVK
jgi:PadR family transcriptional regulator, regulatory protein AphA